MSTLVHLSILIYLCSASNEIVSNVTDPGRATAEKTNENYSACGAVYIEKQFTLKSPNYPENYPANLECYYLLKGPHCPTYYKFEFSDFSLLNSEGCTKDSFAIENQDTLCGNENKTQSYFARNGSLHVRFKTSEGTNGKGYLIRVTRMPCERNEEIATEENVAQEISTENAIYEDANTTTRLPSILSRMYLPSAEQKNTQCCNTIYKEKQFIIASPNFPFSINTRTECNFEIHKTNENVCRLRFNFLFFWIGYTNTNNCPHGFLEIDGKYICGCNSNLKLSTTFGKGNIKTLKFKTDGYYQSYKSGFVVEIIQDECPKKYSPENWVGNKTNYEIRNDEINKVAWPSDSQNIIEKLQLINERTEILDDADEEGKFAKNKPKIIKSFYVFAPQEHDEPALNLDKEKTTYLDINNINTVLTNTDYFQCLNWNQMQYNFLNTRFGKELECKRNEENAASNMGDKECVDLGYVAGYFRSPGYPCFYPANLNICYRLRKLPGYCAIRIFVNDFQIESSTNCVKDYFLLENGERHCGYSLNKASWTIDLRYKEHEDMIFASDDYYCARGFSGVYQQIACQDDFPIHPVDTTTPPIVTTTPDDDNCHEIIREKSFTLEMNGGHRMCTFNVRKYRKDVCKINFYFEKFDLACAMESLILDGTMYCGHMTGRVVKVNVNSASMDILYRSTLENKHDDLRFKIRGEQIHDDCLFVEKPNVQRLLTSKQEATQDATNNLLENNLDLLEYSKYLIAFLDKNFKDICGIVTNSTEKELPSSFCDVFTRNYNTTKCMPLKKEFIPDMPHETKTLALPNNKIEKEIEEIEIHEIDCDNINISDITSRNHV